MTTTSALRRSLIGILSAIAAAVALVAALAADPDPRQVRLEQRIAELTPYAQLPVCAERPDETRWNHAGKPDSGRAKPLISAHRGGNTLAPENTLAAYEAAFAYGVDFVEVDVRETKDGHFVANHDATVDRTTTGTGNVADLTLAEVKALNAADYAPWRGGPYDPSQIATLDEILALATRAGAGLELDIKIGAAAHGRIAKLVDAYGLATRSIFNSGSVEVLKAARGARLIYNRDSWEEPSLLFKVARVSPVFGSTLAEYSPEAIAAIHDACGVVMPHAYDRGGAQEAAEFLAARAIGADGVQTNQPALIVATAGTPVASRLKFERTGQQLTGVCLVNDRNDMGLLGKTIQVSAAAKLLASVTTVQHGCARLPQINLDNWRDVEVRFDGDAAVAPTRAAPAR